MRLQPTCDRTVDALFMGNIGSMINDVESFAARWVSAVAQIIRRNSGQWTYAPDKLSAALVGAFKGLRGQTTRSVETACSQWHQFAIWAVRTVAGHTQTLPTRPAVHPAITSQRDFKSFFISQKVNSRNTP